MLWGLFKNNKVEERKFVIALVLGIFIGSFLFVLLNYLPARKDVVFGVTFSKKYAEELGLDWQKAYLEILDDLKVKALRLPVYWDDVEKEAGKYDWQAYDWMVEEAAKRNAEIILTVGIKLPRWPECHIPNWVILQTNADGTRTDAEESAQSAGSSHQRNLYIEDLFLPFFKNAIERYRQSLAVKYFQIENEPYFFRSFGVCPELDEEFFEKEIMLAKSLAGRPVVSTESGELGRWERMADKADILGISLYRVTWNRWAGYFFYPLTPVFYREKIKALRPFFEDIIITELQLEPWSIKSLNQTPLKEQFKSMNLSRFKRNINFAKRVGASEVYLWGVEWWYYMRNMGHDEFWREGKNLFHYR